MNIHTQHGRPGAGDSSLWAHDCGPAAVDRPVNGRISTKLAIIGAGYTGLSAALHAAQNGVDVTVIEAGSPGAGGSGRNAAGLGSLWAGALPSQIIERFGEERGARMNEMNAQSTLLVRSIIETYDLKVDLRTDGMFMAAHAATAVPMLEALAGEWSDLGNAISFWQGDDLKEALRTDRYENAIKFDAGGTLNPLAYVRGLAGAAQQEGAEIYTGDPALSLTRGNGRWQIQTATGSVDAEWVVVATNAYSENIWPDIKKCFYRTPVAVIASAPVADADNIFPKNRVPVGDTHPANLFWFLLDRDARIVASLLPTISDNAGPTKLGRIYEKKLRRIYPDTPKLDWQFAWQGFIAIRPDRTPRVFEMAPNLLAPLGYSGQGITTATAVGKEVAHAVAQNDRNACAMAIEEPQPVPLPNMVPHLLRTCLFPLIRMTDRTY